MATNRDKLFAYAILGSQIETKPQGLSDEMAQLTDYDKLLERIVTDGSAVAYAVYQRTRDLSLSKEQKLAIMVNVLLDREADLFRQLKKMYDLHGTPMPTEPPSPRT